MFTPDKIQELIDYLQGTCNSLDDGVQTIFGEDFSSFNLSSENHEQIDNEIFLCETCGWWCEMSESGDEDGNCTDCSEDQ